VGKQKEIVFIMNPISGTRQKKQVPNLVEKLLDKQKFTHRFALTERPQHATELAHAAAEAGAAAVIAVGGDGTVNEVAAGLMHTNTALGILPFGSGNGLARHLKIPVDTAAAIQLINNWPQLTIDAALANGKPFFCTAGLGFDAHIGKLFHSTKTRGFSTYFKLALQEYINYSPQKYTLKLPAKDIERVCFVVTIANAGQYGNDAYISPQASVQDGLLDICVLQPFPSYVAAAVGLRLFQKTMHESQYMEIIRTESLTLCCATAECMHLDGEFFELNGPLEIKVVPQCLKVLSPGE
jgi:YegS/Rv2252/BmrU family lipid kinase